MTVRVPLATLAAAAMAAGAAMATSAPAAACDGGLQTTISGVPAAHRAATREAIGCITAAAPATPEQWSARLLQDARAALLERAVAEARSEERRVGKECRL